MIFIVWISNIKNLNCGKKSIFPCNDLKEVELKKLIIIVVSNFIFRAFFAIRPLHAPDGTPVNAVYGVLSMIYNIIIKYQPSHILIARDTKEGSFRKDVYQEYKANRSAPPDDLVPQFALVEKLFHKL